MSWVDFYTVCSVPWLNGNLALVEKCFGPLRFRLSQVSLYLFFRNHTFSNIFELWLFAEVLDSNQLRFSSSHVLARHLTARTVCVQRHRFCSVSGHQHMAHPLMHASSPHHQQRPHREQPPRHNHAAPLSVILAPATRTRHLHNRLTQG